MLKRLDSVVEPGGRDYTEDLLFAREELCFVADGASPVADSPFLGYPSIACWLVETFGGCFGRCCDPALPVPRQVKECMDRIVEAWPLERVDAHLRPSFTLSSVRQADGRLYLDAIGDSAIYLLAHDGRIERFYDERVAPFAARTIAVAQAVRRCAADAAQLLRQRHENLERRNRPGGYWVVGYEPGYECEFRSECRDAAAVDRILICSDGFDRLFAEFALAAPREVLTGALPLREALLALRGYECRHGDEAEYPCVKRHDDATALLLRVE